MASYTKSSKKDQFGSQSEIIENIVEVKPEEGKEEVLQNPTVAQPVEEKQIAEKDIFTKDIFTAEIVMETNQILKEDIQESPIEEKIYDLMAEQLRRIEPEGDNSSNSDRMNGWNDIENTAILHGLPRNGMPVRLSVSPHGEGVLAFWKKTRAFHAKRWQETGVWCDFFTGVLLNFIPKYWKPRH